MYKKAIPDIWNGRIDDKNNKKSFRFHQMVQCKNIAEIKSQEGNTILIGFESDEGVRRNKGRTGAAQGPDKIKEMMAKLPYNINQQHLIDVGNVICEGDRLEKAQTELGKKITEILNHKHTPIILGGGHETLYGHYLGVRNYIKDNNSIGIINIDAHFDMRKEDFPSSGTMFKQILDEDSKAVYLCLGIQEFGNTKALFETAESYGCQYILEEDITSNQFKHTFDVIDQFAQQYDVVMFTLCSDSLNASEAPGVSAPSPLGLEAKTVRTLLRHISKKQNAISFDISEVNPLVDENEKTSKLAAILVAEVMKFL